MRRHVEEGLAEKPEPSHHRLRWSHDALQQAGFALPLLAEEHPRARSLYKRYDELLELHTHQVERELTHQAESTLSQLDRIASRLEDCGRSVTVTISEPGGALTVLPALTPAVIAAWLYATPAPLPSSTVMELLGGEDWRRCGRLLAAFEAVARRRAQATETRCTREEAQQQEQLLTVALAEGLGSRLQQQILGAEEAFYFHALARGVGNAVLRLCERCQLVFAARRARDCGQCRHSPARPKARPWHTAIHPADHTAGKVARIAMVPGTASAQLIGSTRTRLGPGRNLYEALCEQCGCEFRSFDARRRYCKACGAPKARVARHRRPDAPFGASGSPV